MEVGGRVAPGAATEITSGTSDREQAAPARPCASLHLSFLLIAQDDSMDAYMDIGGTIPWMGEGRVIQDDSMDGIDTRPWMVEDRTMQDDSMDGIDRVESGTETEQLPSSCRTETEQAEFTLFLS